MKEHQEMSLVDHLSELRKRVVRVVIVFVLAAVVGFVVAQPIILFLMSVPPADQFAMNIFSPWDSLRIYINVAVLVSLIITLPYALYQVWQFVSPGLHGHEKRAAVSYIPLAFVLGICGLAFAYYVVFPLAFAFTHFLAQTMELTAVYGITQYFSFMFNILLPVTFVFEMPVIVLFLTTIRILTPKVLIKVRKIAYVVLVVISTMITPPDFISALIVYLPLVLLYEISILLSKQVYRRQQTRQQADEERLQET